MGPYEVCGLDEVTLGLAQGPSGELAVPQSAFAHDPVDGQPHAVRDLIEFEPRTAALHPLPSHKGLGCLDGIKTTLGCYIAHGQTSCSLVVECWMTRTVVLREMAMV